MARGARLPPSRPSMDALIRRRGATTRRMGRRRKASRPVSTLKKGCPASKPHNRRIVVPEPSQSSTLSGSHKPCAPTPCTRIRVGVAGSCSTSGFIFYGQQGTQRAQGLDSPFDRAEYGITVGEQNIEHHTAVAGGQAACIAKARRSQLRGCLAGCFECRRN